MLEKKSYPSPNYDERPSSVKPDMIILHYTDMRNTEEALGRLCDGEAKVSAHFLIDKTGKVYQLVNPSDRAWHAGVSSWRGETDINTRSLGIELDNRGHTFGPEAFPDVQIQTLLVLLEELTKNYGIAPHHILGHSDVAPLRKIDPGPLFPWATLAQNGFGVWPSSPEFVLKFPPDITISEFQKALMDIGYACPHSGVWDEDTQNTCRAFQRHFVPHELTGQRSAETCQMVQVIRELSLGHPPYN